MSEVANVLAELLTKMDQKLDALAEQQKQLDAKLERYSAFLVKKMNDTAETLTNVQTAQAKLVTEEMTKMTRQMNVMERQIAGHPLPEEETSDAVLQKLNETSESLHHSIERSINLIGYHGRTIEQNLAEYAKQVSQLRDLQAAVPELTDAPETPDAADDRKEWEDAE